MFPGLADEDPKLYGDRTELAHTPPRARPPSRGFEPSGTPSAVTPSDTWSDDPWDRTSHAREGAQLARVIELRAARWTVPAGPARRLLIQDPEERTGGGARARLPIVLQAEDRRWGALVIGWLDAPAGRLELRPHAWVDEQHQARFDAPWPVTPEAYEGLARELASAAAERGVGVVVAESATREAQGEARADVPRWVWVALGVLIGVASAFVAIRA